MGAGGVLGSPWGVVTDAAPGGFPSPPRHSNLPVWHGDPPPVMCEAGPCAHYHEMEVVIDSQQPIDGSAGEIHTEKVRTCYPHWGVEMDLKGVPVLSCSRWCPVEGKDPDVHREEHTRKVAEWKDAQKARRDEIEQAATAAVSEAAFVDASDDDE